MLGTDRDEDHADRAVGPSRLHPRSRKPLPFGRGMKRYLKASIMPDVKAALARMSVVAPQDPQLFLAKHFLAQSTAGEAYEIRRQSSVVRSYLPAGSGSLAANKMLASTVTSTTADATHAFSATPNIRLNLHPTDALALSAATAPGLRSLSRVTHPTLDPLTTWQKRLVRIEGKRTDSSCQTGAEGLGVDKGCQAARTYETAECQTLMTGHEALKTLGQEITAYKARCEQMQSEELAIGQVFRRVVVSSGIEKRLSNAFRLLDLQGRGFLTRTSLLMGLTRHPDALRAVPALRSLFRPINWQRAFDAIVRERDNKSRPSDTLQITAGSAAPSLAAANADHRRHHRDPRRIREEDFYKYLLNHASLDKNSFLSALQADPTLQSILKWSETLHPLLRPRQYSSLFDAISSHKASGRGDGRITAKALLMHLRRGRMGAAEDAASEAVSSLFWLLADEETGLLDQNRLLFVVSRSTPPGDVEAEEALAVIGFSVALRPLLKPSKWLGVFQAADANKDGLLTYAEFFEFIKRFAGEEGGALAQREDDRKRREMEMRIATETATATMARLRSVFDLLDTERTGLISRRVVLRKVLDDEKLRGILRGIPPLRALLKPGSWAKVFSQVDADADERLNFGEFAEFVFAAYAVDLVNEAQQNNSEGSENAAQTSIAMLRGVALGAGRVGVTIAAVDAGATKSAVEETMKLLDAKVADAVTEAKKVQPLRWRSDLVRANAAAVRIQALWRGVEERTWAKEVEDEMRRRWALDLLRTSYATKIQSLWRGFQVRLEQWPKIQGQEDVDLWREICVESAQKIQRAFRSYRIRAVMGVGQKKRDDIWISTGSFEARADDELTLEKVGVLLWLRDDMIDPVTDPSTQMVSGWYQAQLFNCPDKNVGEELDKDGEDKAQKPDRTMDTSSSDKFGKLVPSFMVRRCTKQERAAAILGRLPIWVKILCGRYRRWYYYSEFRAWDFSFLAILLLFFFFPPSSFPFLTRKSFLFFFPPSHLFLRQPDR
jgi:Ca2+-binding EF-hand superfamily protein